MPESYTPREITDKINEGNNGPAFDPYGTQALRDRLRAQKAQSGDIFAEAELGLASEKRVQDLATKDLLEFLSAIKEAEYVRDLYPEIRQQTLLAAQKAKAGQELSKKELALIYRVADINPSEDVAFHQELDEIIAGRNQIEDLNYIFDGIKEWPGGIYISAKEDLDGLIMPKNVQGRLCLANLKTAHDIGFPDLVEGDLELAQLEEAAGLELPLEVNGDVYLGLHSAANVTLPTVIDGSLYLEHLYRQKGLKLPNIIRGFTHLSELTATDGVEWPDSFLTGKITLRKLPEEQKEALRKQHPNLEFL